MSDRKYWMSLSKVYHNIGFQNVGIPSTSGIINIWKVFLQDSQNLNTHVCHIFCCNGVVEFILSQKIMNQKDSHMRPSRELLVKYDNLLTSNFDINCFEDHNVINSIIPKHIEEALVHMSNT